MARSAERKRGGLSEMRGWGVEMVWWNCKHKLVGGCDGKVKVMRGI